MEVPPLRPPIVALALALLLLPLATPAAAVTPDFQLCDPPLRLSDNHNGNAVRPQMVYESSGNATVAWFQIDNGVYAIWAARFVAGEGWHAPVVVSQEPGRAFRPVLALGPEGVVTAVWYQEEDVRYRMMAARYTAETGWSDPEPIERREQGMAWDPDLAAGPSGELLAVWKVRDNGSVGVQAALASPEGEWDVARLVDGGTGGDPAVVGAGFVAGDVPFAAWQSFNASGASVWVSRYYAPSGWGPPEKKGVGIGLFPKEPQRPSEPPAVPRAWTAIAEHNLSIVLSNLCTGGPVEPPLTDPWITVDPLRSAYPEGVVPFTGRAGAPEGVAFVEYRVDGGPWGPAFGQLQWTARPEVAKGHHTIEARLTTANGRTANASVAFDVVPAGGAPPQDTDPPAPGPPPVVYWDPPVLPPAPMPELSADATPLEPDAGTTTPVDAGAPYGWIAVLGVLGGALLVGAVLRRRI
jgi:hypothetical protein